MEDNSEENRKCGCGKMMDSMNCNYTPDGINAAFGYNTASLSDELNCNCSNNTDECWKNRDAVREEMMRQIKCLNFAIVELAEYLDTHPTDQKALCLHREYCNQYNQVKEKYQKIFGPLSIYCPCNKWRWLEEPWPWERSDSNVDL